ncbi:MAG: DUF4956 domain-containing protein [Leptospiraceae bacterium]|nr:DUF4956 domain-containing protein [Leptospiraceae bacterium]
MGIEELFKSISTKNQVDLNLWELSIRLFFAAAIGFYITFISFITNINKSNQHRISQAQVLLTVVCALIINVIGYNIAWAIGLIGTLSFIRFRTTLRDPRDTAIFFYSIALGIATGAGEYALAIVGMFVFTLILFIFKYITFYKKEPFVIKLICNGQEENKYFESYFEKLKIEFQLLDFSFKKKKVTYKIYLAGSEFIKISERLHLEFGEKLLDIEKESLDS